MDEAIPVLQDISPAASVLPELWAPFVGENAVRFPVSLPRPPGPARLARHLGLALSSELWDDLHRLRVETMRIVLPDETYLSPAWFHAILFLDHQLHVNDIWLHGQAPIRKSGHVFEA